MTDTMSDSQLKARRKTLKGQLTRTKTYLTKLSPTAPVDELRERLQQVQKSFVEFDAIQSQLEENETVVETNEDDDSVDEKRREFEESYYEVVGAATARIRQAEQASAATTSRDQSSPSTPMPAVSVQSSSSSLPKITLPTFDGDYQQWQSFHDLFRSIVHNLQGVPNVIKLYHLRTALTGEAAKLIQALELTDNNYEVAWKLVCERYQKKRLLVQQHTRSFLRLQPLHRESHAELRCLIDEARRHVEALRALKEPVQYWDTILIQVLVEKLDKTSIREWEMRNGDDEVPTLKALLDYLSHRCSALEAVYRPDSISQVKLNQGAHGGERGKAFNKSNKPFTSRAHANVAQQNGCYKCSKPHPLYSCSDFKDLNVKQRIQEVQRHGLCHNCLRKSHPGSECKGSCRVCFKAHNTLLHSDERSTGSKDGDQAGATRSLTNTAVATALASGSGYEALLASAIINVLDHHGEAHTCRALLDSGSTSNFMTTELCRRLQLKTYKQNISIDGIGGTCTQGTHHTSTTIKSRVNGYYAKLTFIMMDKVTGSLPVLSVNDRPWKIPDHIRLADPDYYLGGRVDMLGRGLPVLQKTKLGWIVAGDLSGSSELHRGVCNIGISKLDVQVEKFWHLEEDLHHQRVMSPEESQCEDLFVSSVSVGEDGRFTVALPLRESAVQIGDSFQGSLKRLESLERRFNRDPGLKESYVEFMREYQELGHMTSSADRSSRGSAIRYYLPHHAVLRPDSSTTKLRVVFDASAASTSGHSLNDLLLVGPTVQEDLLSLILRFRRHRFVVTADIEKMYRQVWIQPDHRNLQCILWREKPSDPPTTFQLKTITYGTAAAPFLATRCLKKIADDLHVSNPSAARVIAQDFYVDDMITGGDDVDEVVSVCREVSSALNERGFKLRKWCSNHEQVLMNQQNTPSADSGIVDFGDCEESKTLGVRWHPVADTLQYNININVKSRKITKRSILSEIAQIFDPLGLLSPVIILAKIVMQELWQLKIGWDEAVPMSMDTQWQRYRETLSTLNSLQIPRRVIDGDHRELQLHGFSDASEKAYGACIYMRSTNQLGEVSVELLCAKSRVAPLKQKPIPSLELCAAVLLAELHQKVKSSLKINIPAYFWTDSELVLAWLADEPRRWTTFIGNRVSKIQQLTKVEEWRHVPGISNPADLVSRGMLPEELINGHLWWSGPDWLRCDIADWPRRSQTILEIPGRRKTALCHVGVSRVSSINSFSSLEELLTATSLCFRIYQLCTGKNTQSSDHSLSVDERQQALKMWIKIGQREEFGAEISSLVKKQSLDRKSRLLSLNPFIDEEGLLRVGGRLGNSDQDFDQKHPMILSSHHRLTELIVIAEHKRLLHAGAQSVLANVRLRYWIVRGRDFIKKIIRQCTSCAHVKPIAVTPQMGHLPANRTRECRPFINSGVDYAGPIYIKAGGRRSQTKMKGYIALFVCFSTKAIHLELVTALTTEAFLSALRRFMARRGRVANLYSDNGTNFVGAARQLQDLAQTIQSSDLKEPLGSEGIRWHFIPPRSPHFGGLWEAGVRSVKHHLRRILGEASLTYEEYSTVLTQIEACLNSRPITCISSDPDDPLPLTPGHFLIGEPLMALPDPDFLNVPDNRLDIWERLQKLKQTFWKRWSTEYLGGLQERTKWLRGSAVRLAIGDAVLLKDNQLPPLQWTLGRVIKLHLGKDNVARVATVKTSKGEMVRAITQLCLLPEHNNATNDIQFGEEN